jgi:hypothetical protein
LLNKCNDGDLITSTNIQITSDFKIQMDTDPANEFYYDLCVSCSNRNVTVKSDNFFLHTYYPCEDELSQGSTAQVNLDMVRKIIEEKQPTVDSRAIFSDSLGNSYLVNSDPTHCPILSCSILSHCIA